jgi:hypothetical protein
MATTNKTEWWYRHFLIMLCFVLAGNTTMDYFMRRRMEARIQHLESCIDQQAHLLAKLEPPKDDEDQ